MDNIIKNAKYSIVESIDPRLVEVVVTFSLDGEVRQHYIFLKKKNGTPRQTYLKQAEAQFKKDLETDKINAARRALGNKNRRKPGLVFFFAFATCAAMSMAGLFTYQYFTQPVTPGGGGDVPVGDLTVGFDSASTRLTISPTTAEKNKAYEGTITVTDSTKALNTSGVVVTINNEELAFGDGYDIESLGKSSGKYQYKLTIDASKMVDNVVITAPCDAVSEFKITDQQTLNASFKFDGIKNLQVEETDEEDNEPTEYIFHDFSSDVYREELRSNYDYNDDFYNIVNNSSNEETCYNYTRENPYGLYTYAEQPDVSDFETPTSFHEEYDYYLETGIFNLETNLEFDDKNLNYFYTGEPIDISGVGKIFLTNLEVSYYNDLPVKFKMYTVNYEEVEECVTLSYNYPSDEQYSIELPKKTETCIYNDDTTINKDQWGTIIDQYINAERFKVYTQDMSKVNDDKDGSTRYFENKKTFVEPNISDHLFYDKEDDGKCYRYQLINNKWEKINLTEKKLEDEYYTNSANRIKDILSEIKKYPDKFDREQPVPGYFPYKFIGSQDEKIAGYQDIDIWFRVRQAVEGDRKEISFERIDLYPNGSSALVGTGFNGFNINPDINVVLPEVK